MLKKLLSPALPPLQTTNYQLPTIMVIVGPTSTGKSDLAVKLARKYNGEIISADSRQVYKGLNIGTGKITTKEMKGVPHHLLNVISPKKQYTASDYIKDARESIRCIVQKNKLPIICGGSGFYISALLGEINLSSVLPNKKLRKQLNNKTTEQLFRVLEKLDPKRAKTIDSKNPARLIRAIEIALAQSNNLAKVPPWRDAKVEPLHFEIIKIGLDFPDAKLKERIHARLLSRIKAGMITEARKLHKSGLSYKRMNELGLEYRYLAKYLSNEISKERMIEKLNTEIWRYAKRQITWFKRDRKIKWFEPKEKKIEKVVKNFIKRTSAQ